MSLVDNELMLAYLSTPYAENARRPAIDSSSLDREAILAYLSVPRPMPPAVQELPHTDSRPKAIKSALNYLSIATSRVFGRNKNTIQEMAPRNYERLTPPPADLNNNPIENWVIIENYFSSSCISPSSSGSLPAAHTYSAFAPQLPTSAPSSSTSEASMLPTAELSELLNSPPVIRPMYPSLVPITPSFSLTNTSSTERLHAPVISVDKPIAAGSSTTPPYSTQSPPPTIFTPVARSTVIVSAHGQVNPPKTTPPATDVTIAHVPPSRNPLFTGLHPKTDAVSSPLLPPALTGPTLSRLAATASNATGNVLIKTKAEAPALILDAGLTPEQAKRITEYTLPILIPELTAVQIAELNAQQQMKRQMEQRNEPQTLRNAIEDIRTYLREIAALNESIGLYRVKAKGATGITLDEIGKNRDNVATLAARKLGILGKVYLGRSEEELKLITEKECLALADRFIVLAQARLDQLAAGPVVAQAPVEETPESKFKKVTKQLATTESNIRSAHATIRRVTAEIVRLQEEIAMTKQRSIDAAIAGDDAASEQALEQHGALVAALESAEKNLNGDLKTGKPSLAKKVSNFEATMVKQRAEVVKLQAQLPPAPVESLIPLPTSIALSTRSSQGNNATMVTNPTISSVVPPPSPPATSGPAVSSRPNPMGGTSALFAAITAKRKVADE